MKIQDRSQFLDLCEREKAYRAEDGPFHPYTIGAVAPPIDLILWTPSVTASDWVQAHREVINNYGPNYSRHYGNALMATRALYYDPEEMRLSDTQFGRPTWRSGSHLPWFTSIDEVDEWSDIESEECTQLFAKLIMATGGKTVADEYEQESETTKTPQEWRAVGKSHGRWMSGMFACQPDAELFVERLDAARNAECQRQATTHGRNGVQIVNSAAFAVCMAARMLHDGPDGKEFVTSEDVANMQMGACQAVFITGQRMSFRTNGDPRSVGFYVVGDTKGADSGGAPNVDVVDGEVPQAHPRRASRNRPKPATPSDG